MIIKKIPTNKLSLFFLIIFPLRSHLLKNLIPFVTIQLTHEQIDHHTSMTLDGFFICRFAFNADRHEGELTGLVTLLEFESNAAAEKFYFSDEYQAAKAIRDNGVDTDLMIIEGL